MTGPAIDAPERWPAAGKQVDVTRPRILTRALTRWWAGRYGDRHGPASLLIPGVLAAAIGMLALVLIARPAAVVLGMVLFGAGFGVTQNASLALMLDGVSTSGYAMVSAVWNLAYDAGLGLGAAGFGLLAAQTGYPAAFALTAALMLAALAPAWRESPWPSGSNP